MTTTPHNPMLHSVIKISEPELMRTLVPPHLTERPCDSRARPNPGFSLLASLLCFLLSLAGGMRRGVIAASAIALAVMASIVPPARPLLSKDQRRRASTISSKRYFVVVLQEKGGVGKSLMLQIAYEVVAGDTKNVLVLDADVVNGNMKRLKLTKDENVVEADRVDFEGFLFDAVRKLTSGNVDAVVVDSAAGDEKYFTQHLPEMAKTVREGGGRLIVIRPVTTNPMNLDNLVRFGKDHMTEDMGVMMVKNYGMGRTDQDFAIWMGSQEHQDLLDLGMHEIHLENAGALCSDIAAELGVTIAQIALIAPDKLDIAHDKRHIAVTYLTDRFRMFVARWLSRQVTRFEAGFEKALERTFS